VKVERRVLKAEHASFDFREIEDVIDDGQQRIRAGLDRFGKTALIEAVSIPQATPMEKSIQNVIVTSLLDNGADVNLKDQSDTTALQFALVYCGYDVVETLVKAGADVNARDKKGHTPLGIARKIPLDNKTINLLKRAGATN